MFHHFIHRPVVHQCFSGILLVTLPVHVKSEPLNKRVANRLVDSAFPFRQATTLAVSVESS